MRLNVDVVVLSPLWRPHRRAKAQAREAILAAAAACGVTLQDGAEAALHLCDDAHIRTLNKTWRGLDKPTNVLSFPAVQPQELAEALLLGDVVVAHETVAREAAVEGKSFADHFRHLVTHGFLHLVGFDHETEADARAMEAVERRALARLGVADPYADLELAEASP
jgi:probable rRNA maturation factor